MLRTVYVLHCDGADDSHEATATAEAQIALRFQTPVAVQVRIAP